MPPLVPPPPGNLPLYTTAMALTQSFHERPAKAQNDAQILTANGFQAGAWEYLHGPHRTLKRAGLSWANWLGSPQGAAQQLSADLEGPRARLKRQGLRVPRVTVPGIPRSTGYTVQDKRRRYYPAANLFFTVGSYEYFVGEDGFNSHNLRDTSTAARAIYNRAIAAGC
jgi:hypothetical protein